MPQNKYSQEDVRIILRAALKGDREAAVTLLQNYTNEMYFAARLYLEDKTDAKKTVQLAFNTAYTRLQEAETEQDFAKWLRSIVRECAVKRISPLQAETAEVPYSTEDERVSGDLSLPDEKTCRKYLLQGFGVFTPEERIVAAMRYYDHLTVDHIARILNTSRGHVEDWLSCGKEALHRSGILIGRIIALINAINDVPAEVEESYAPRHASSAVVFPEDPDNENTSFRNFRDLSNEPLPDVEEEKKVEEPKEKPLEFPKIGEPVSFGNKYFPSLEDESANMNFGTAFDSQPNESIESILGNQPDAIATTPASINNVYQKPKLTNAINMTRELISNVQKAGNKVETQELDLADEYQIIIRIKKEPEI